MQIDARDHFYAIVMPAIEAYKLAETELTRAVVEKYDEAVQEAARFKALREGGAAAIYLHHLSDVIANRPPESLAKMNGDVGAVRKWLIEQSRSLSGDSDVALLGDVADALKHAVLTRRLPREVEAADQVLAIKRGFGTGRYGEGKYGGIDEVWVLGRSGKRPLASVLLSIANVWDSVFNELP